MVKLLNSIALNTTWEIFKTLEKEQISINYLGEFKDHNTDFIISLSESNIEHNLGIKKLKKKVSFLITESFQNIIRHGDDILAKNDQQLKSSPFFSIRVENDIIITSANAIKNSFEGELKKIIEQLNSLNEEQLKEMYLDVLNNSGLSEKGGAGLGLIEMARKSGQKLQSHFEKVDDEISMFYLQVKINLADNPTSDDGNPIEFRNYFLDKKVLFAYKGEFSGDSITSLLSIIENNLSTLATTDGKHKKSFIVLVELLQNVSKHGYATHETVEGIFTVSIKDGSLYFSTGNWIAKDETEKLCSAIDFINTKNLEDMKALYKKIITSEKNSTKEGAGLGLINIVRFTTNKIHYSIHENNINDDVLNFVTITVKI